MIPDRALNPRVKRGDRVRVVEWGAELTAKYAGLEGTVRDVSRQGVVVVDLDHDPLTTHAAFRRMGLIFDPAFSRDRFERIGGSNGE